MLMELIDEILKKEQFVGYSNLKKFSSGAANTIYKFKFKDNIFVLKINISGNETFENEFQFLNYIRKKGFKQCPKPISEGILKKTHYMIQEFVSGETLCEGKLSDRQVRLMAKFYKNLHSFTFKRLGTIPNPRKSKYSLKGVLSYAETIIKNLIPSVLSNSELKKLNNFVLLTRKQINKADVLFSNEKKFSLRHGDANPLNFIDTKEKIIGIDWVWGCVAPSSKEIADFINKSEITKKQISIFYKEYGRINKLKVNAHFLYSYLGTAIWSLDRLNKIESGKLASDLYESKEKEKLMYSNQIKKLNKLLKEEGVL